MTRVRPVQGVQVSGGEHAPYAAELLRAAGPDPLTVRLVADPALPEGGFRIDVPETGDVVLTGDPFAGLVYAARELAGRITPAGLPVGVHADEPGLPLRTLWTWDHSTNWDERQLGQQEIGALNPYGKGADAFGEDYRRLVDFCSRERIGGIVVYGLLRDAHGGVDAARELCAYANARGVRIIAGIGVNAYGGIYFDGRHRFNLATHLRQRPELSAVLPPKVGFDIDEFGDLHFPASEYMMAACPSHPDNLAWHRDAIDWLLDTVGVGGINFETGDYGSCACGRCAARTGGERTSWSYEAMRAVYPTLLDTARRTGPAGVPLRHLVEVYWDNIFDLDAQKPLADLPDDVAYQYCVNRGFWYDNRDRLTADHVAALPHTTNVLRTHGGSQWNRQRHSLVADMYADMATRGGAAGMRGLTIFAEPSAYHPTNEISYLAYARFTWNPDLAWDDFWRDEVVPRFGGAGQAEAFRAGAARLDDPTATAEDLSRVRGEALDVVASTTGEVQRRWLWLAERTARHAYALTPSR
ncbi:hypothetical protein [Polymorphospora rubra]|uniref:Uncharacterized protein n=1 Tax=Polymorphospora rubra TaxID=338584 RepID=A0A810N597_9ACTN|nr:hypothetical protein [Polymorphospora rubra]BCJ68921.1 hypothetical protein Prubr_59420 [Polymorphospora rubra]